ncbi:hypothetical protein GALL_144440 [mine drainage metagenome]|uniref:Uncharacterized protein n=1 Tax=mine drainage metagenome TaxID=410659 RepID=A0A1J5S569_9ZZZZ
MTPIWRFAIRFYLPLALAFSFLSLLPFSPEMNAGKSSMDFLADFHIGIIGLQLPLTAQIERTWLLDGTLLLMALVCVIWAFCLDFSKFFPSTLHMDVYFDVAGIGRTLATFSTVEIESGAITTDWIGSGREYENVVLASLEQHWKLRKVTGFPHVEEITRDHLHARGETLFEVERTSILRYRIRESRGHLNFQVDVPKHSPFRFKVEFVLRETPANHIRPSLWSLMARPWLVIAPEFKQIFVLEQGNLTAPFDHIVVGMTRIVLLPFPGFSNTLYVWRSVDSRNIPIGYAVYY